MLLYTMPDLAKVLADLLADSAFRSQLHHYRHIKDHLEHCDTSTQLQLLHELLCIRSPQVVLSEKNLKAVDQILTAGRSRKVLTLADTIPPSIVFSNSNNNNKTHPTRVALWRGDITTLTNITAIVNAGNSRGLGCFQPSHRCIDNVIHSEAGPRLRDECHSIMSQRSSELSPGEAFTTKGYCLPSQHVIHTVGPQLSPGAGPSPTEKSQLAACYVSALDAAELLPPLESGRKIIAFCCISTGLFSFPGPQAAAIALDAVHQWLNQHPDSTITDVIFNTFTEDDDAYYQEALARVFPKFSQIQDNQSSPSPRILCPALGTAREWLTSADCILVSAGAGLSAATGLDYTSKRLFSQHFPAFTKRGLSTLYSVFGYQGWRSEEDRWGYYFTHLNMVRNWPRSDLYDTLLSWLRSRGVNTHIRTTNADGLFLAHGWPAEKLSTPQGSYAVFQCLDNCRPEAVVPSGPYIEAAASSLDATTQQLKDASKVPRCRFCGGKMSICVRAGSWFNDTPFQNGELAWKAFRRSDMESAKRVVILELGVGENTPGVLKWPNEDLVARSEGRVKLIRMGLGASAFVPSDLEASESAIAVNGDLKVSIKELLR